MGKEEILRGGICLTDQEILKLHIAMVPFMAEVLGPGCEVVVHDITNLKHSVVAIRNNLSGRNIGDPMTDLSLEEAHSSDYVANYSGRSKGREFLSSTYYIKNEGRLIGLFCVNKNVSNVKETSFAIHTLLEQFNLIAPDKTGVSENLDGSVDIIMRTRISDAIAQSAMPPERLSPREKVHIAHLLKADGVLSMKGAIAELADQLQVSVPTIYRYLNKKEE